MSVIGNPQVSCPASTPSGACGYKIQLLVDDEVVQEVFRVHSTTAPDTATLTGSVLRAIKRLGTIKLKLVVLNENDGVVRKRYRIRPDCARMGVTEKRFY